MPNMTDIAKQCGISRSAVSLVLSGRDKELGIAASTRDQILRVARELGYCRNELAASIARKHSQVLAFVTAKMGSIEYTGRIQNGVLDAASGRGYTVTVHRLGTVGDEEIVRRILGWRAAGVIFHVADLKAISAITSILEKNDIPWGTVNLNNPGGIGVTSDDRTGIENAVRLLAERGHRRIAFLANGKKAVFEYQVTRETGYLDGMKKYLPDRKALKLRLSEPGKMNDMNYLSERILPKLRGRADAVICESDQLAAALGRAAQMNGDTIPGTFSLVGFGNSVISETFSPPLSTIAQDFEEMGSRTVNWLADVIEKKPPAVQAGSFIPTAFIERGSMN
ncbi:MAG: LacI family DNA-binding transcriptional regulator [Lentisphaeria bacterium]|nr:LacI family DNA-binding transcriptional regulator [Lentisphaeria bacterium]